MNTYLTSNRRDKAVQIADELIRLADEQGGGTVSTETGKEVVWDTGYAVASHGIVIEKIDGDESHLEALVDFLDIIDAEYVGSWLDGDLYYIDVTENVADLDRAVALGKQRNQLAIWDCAGGTEIDLRS